MAELVPAPFEALVRRAFAEHATRDSIYDLPSRSWYRPPEDLDLAVWFHGQRVATPVGPAAGPQTQMAQNLVLSWLAGSRVLELKTVQIKDRLIIPRPCIDAHNVGYNIEWSQELLLEQSLHEYAKAWLLIHMLARADVLRIGADVSARECAGTLFDLSIGYDLDGVRSDPVTDFVRATLDVGDLIDEYRAQVPAELAHLADVEVESRMVDNITLSTFHGCPGDQIESMVRYLLDDIGVHVVVKMNPPLLGHAAVVELLQDRLGYRDVDPPADEFAADLQWDDAIPMLGRLIDHAASLGKPLGVKLTNTCIVKNHRDFFETKTMYLSGEPLHAIAMAILARLRETLPEVPVSFSGGVNRRNFPDCVALGLVPVTTSSDLLRPGGYGRLPKYLANLVKRMRTLNVSDIPAYIRASQLDAGEYAERVAADPRYHYAKNASIPKKIGSVLELLDCVNCDKCIAVCPNDANFDYALEAATIHWERLVVRDGGVIREPGGVLNVESSHQLANFADFCNECGNCDVFCPEDGGPFVLKPRFFGSLAQWRELDTYDGLAFERARNVWLVYGRYDGLDYHLRLQSDGSAIFDDGTLVARFEGHVLTSAELADTTRPAPEEHVLSLEPFHALSIIARAVLDPARPNPVNAPWLELGELVAG